MLPGVLQLISPPSLVGGYGRGRVSHDRLWAHEMNDGRARNQGIANKASMDESRFSVFDEVKLCQELARSGIKPLHAVNIHSYILAHRDSETHNVPGLPKAAYPLLESKFKALTTRVQEERNSADCSTTKLLIQLQSGQSVEAVIMRYNASAGKYAGGQRSGGPRATLCVSSQVGCQMGCTFCATGTMGLKGNLTAGEIVEQLVHASKITTIRNIVFMGMGEPLNNYNAVLQAVGTMTGRAFGVSASHITISTVGITPRMLSLAHDLPGVNLALSLHAPTQELRCQIVPAARAYPLHKLMAALDSYLATSGSKVLVEYVMLDAINDTEEIAHQLGELLRSRLVVLNLIPYNPSVTVSNHKPSSEANVKNFQKIIREVYGVRATVRQEMGQDISGACGQLAASRLDVLPENSGCSSQAVPPSSRLMDIEELCAK